MFAFDGAIVTAIRPNGFFGKPLFAASVTSVQVLPPSAERYRPLAEGEAADSPPERKVQPLRRKSHSEANTTLESFGSSDTDAQPVDRFAPFNTCDQCAPPSVVLYKPRSGESFHKWPGTHAYTVSP